MHNKILQTLTLTIIECYTNTIYFQDKFAPIIIGAISVVVKRIRKGGGGGDE